MRLDVTFSGLDGVIRAVGAVERGWRDPTSTLPPVGKIDDDLRGAGIEVTTKTVGRKGRFFVHEGRQVVLYIKDMTGRFSKEAEHNAYKRRRVHLLDCGTITEKKNDGTFNKYVATTRRDDLYEVTFGESQRNVRNEEVELLPCKNCLAELEYLGYKRGSSERIVRSFKIAEFFASCETTFSSLPKHTAETMAIAYYNPDFPIVSKRVREKSGYRCHECTVDLSGQRQLLDTHHIDGVKSNDQLSNLRPLCRLCHAEQPGHGHMKVSSRHRGLIEQLRRMQAQ